jgi:transcriptional regulator with XRE-family HTH domain
MANLLFAENMRCLRERNGLKQAEMLDAIGYKQSTWNGYERGVSSPNLDDLIKISDYFGILESDLLRVQVAAFDIHTLYNGYIAKLQLPHSLEGAPRSASFLSYYNAMDWALALAVKGQRAAAGAATLPDPSQAGRKKGKGLHYTNEDPGGTAPLPDAARIARLEGMIVAMKDILGQFNP